MFARAAGAGTRADQRPGGEKTSFGERKSFFSTTTISSSSSSAPPDTDARVLDGEGASRGDASKTPRSSSEVLVRAPGSPTQSSMDEASCPELPPGGSAREAEPRRIIHGVRPNQDDDGWDLVSHSSALSSRASSPDVVEVASSDDDGDDAEAANGGEVRAAAASLSPRCQRAQKATSRDALTWHVLFRALFATRGACDLGGGGLLRARPPRERTRAGM